MLVNMRKNMIIFDNHLHIRRDGRFIDAVKDFEKAGGTHFVLCQLPMTHFVIKDKNYNRSYEETLKIAKEIRLKTSIHVFVTVGPYPVEYLKLKEKFGREKTIQIMKKGMDLAANLCEEQKCIAIGEIGRPHFPVDNQVIIDSNEILFYGMKKARDVGVPVVLHTESTTSRQCKELVEMGKKACLPPNKIVKHYSPPLILEEENYGVMPSVLASSKNIYSAIKKGSRFLLETDYIDDPRRPGLVLGPKTVPKKTKLLIEKEIFTDEQIYKIHKDKPEKTYNIILD
jgi:TatD-related deoxyribonuclease